MGDTPKYQPVLESGKVVEAKRVHQPDFHFLKVVAKDQVYCLLLAVVI